MVAGRGPGGAVPVAVVFVGIEDVSCVGLCRDEGVVEEFSSDGADDPFAVGVHEVLLRQPLDTEPHS